MGGNWNNGSNAGLWYLNWNNSASNSNNNYAGRFAMVTTHMYIANACAISLV